jgi:hypothetical protein
LDKLFFVVFTTYLSYVRGRPGHCGQQKRPTLANGEDATFRRNSDAGFVASKLPILKWLPANRAVIDLKLAAKMPDFVAAPAPDSPQRGDDAAMGWI